VGLATAGIVAGGSGLVIAGSLQEKVSRLETEDRLRAAKVEKVSEDVSAIKAQVESIKEQQTLQRRESREQAQSTESALREILRKLP